MHSSRNLLKHLALILPKLPFLKYTKIDRYKLKTHPKSMFVQRIQKFTPNVNLSIRFLTLALFRNSRRLAKNGCKNNERGLTSKKRRFCLGFADAHLLEVILIFLVNNLHNGKQFLLSILFISEKL